MCGSESETEIGVSGSAGHLGLSYLQLVYIIYLNKTRIYIHCSSMGMEQSSAPESMGTGSIIILYNERCRVYSVESVQNVYILL